MSKSRFTSEYEVLLKRLIEARKSAGKTQYHIAAKLQKPQSHVSKCESKEREISITDLRLWCLELNIKVSDLIHQWEEDLEK